ncbi:MAG: DNA primase [Thermodesulfovibrionaceae bacterium]
MNFQKVLEEIKARLDIVEVISEYIDLKRTGQNYRSLCPFHSEKTPSFFVSPSKQIFHCFGCGKGGDIVSFIMEYEKVSFSEAVSILAKKAEVEFKPLKESLSSAYRETLYKIYEEASYFFMEELKKSNKAKRYLKDRGIEDKTIEFFQLGYAPEEKDALYKYLKSRGFDDKTIKASGVVTSTGEDFFRDRVTIPIHDVSGKVIGFGGRLIQSVSQLPKYINSPDTPIFKKGESLFGIFQAKSHIREKKYVIVVEGYMDVILSHQYGFKNTVAPLGTSVTEDQLKKLKKFTNKILLIFDGDEAGILAAQRVISSLFKVGFIVKIVLLPKNEDPASLLKKFGEKRLKSYISKAISPVELFVEPGKDSSTENIHNFLLALSFLKDPIYRDELIKRISEKTGISEVALREKLKQFILNRKVREIKNLKKEPFIPAEEETLIGILLSFPEKAREIIIKVSVEDFEAPIIRNIYSKILEIMKENIFSPSSLLNILNEEEKSFISKIIIKTEIEHKEINQIIQDCVKKLYVRNIDRKIKEAAKVGDEKVLNELMKKRKEFLKLTNE